MSAMPEISSIEKGHLLGKKQYQISRDDLVRYAGASGDFNPIHYNDQFAHDVGLPGVLAHGMLTMGLVSSFVEEVLSGRGVSSFAISSFQTRFTEAVVVTNNISHTTESFIFQPGAALNLSATVGAVEQTGDGFGASVRVDVEAQAISLDEPESALDTSNSEEFEGFSKVLGRTQLWVYAGEH